MWPAALVLTVAAAVASTGLGRQDHALDRTAAIRWWTRRTAHVLLAGTAACGKVLGLRVLGADLGTTAFVVRDAAGLMGLAALGAAAVMPVTLLRRPTDRMRKLCTPRRGDRSAEVDAPHSSGGEDAGSNPAGTPRRAYCGRHGQRTVDEVSAVRSARTPPGFRGVVPARGGDRAVPQTLRGGRSRGRRRMSAQPKRLILGNFALVST